MKKDGITQFLTCMMFLTVSMALCQSCSSMYYAAWEQVGKHKRDLLRDNVSAVRDEQMEATEQFKDALTRLKELTGFHGGDLEETYNALKADYEECKEKAEAVKVRIEKIDHIASDLFEEWNQEIETISSTDLRRKSRKKLKLTKERYARLYRAMEKSENRLDPVLTQLRDQVIYLKHNLNAQAIAGLQAEVSSIELDVRDLIRDMETSIAQADEFIKALPE